MALDGAVAHRRGRPRRRHPLAARGLGQASGHLANFTDPLVDCRECQSRWRLDKLEDPGVCPQCGATDSFTEARAFNLMFRTHAGPVEGEGHEVYLRPETAQGHFVNFANVLQASRKKPPFGIAQVGKSFRNEITPGNFIFRTREFEQMEMEYFVPPDEGPTWFEYWCNERMQWYIDLGIPAEDLQLRHHDADELSHYSAGTADIDYRFPWGFDELEGIANRTDYDLKQHAEHSGEALDYFDTATETRYVPHVIEPAAGATRTLMAFLLSAYDEEEVKGETWSCSVYTTAWRRTRWRSCPCPARSSSPAPPRTSSPASPPSSCATTTRPSRSAGATAVRTSWARPTP